MAELNVVKRLREIQRKIEELSQKQVVAGVIDDSTHEDRLSNADLLAIHEFGAIIDHPGGTSYGYRTERQAKQGKVRFLGKGQGYMELGKTGAHKIIIPERPVMRIALANNKQVIRNMLSRGVAECLRGNSSVDDVYNHVGNYLRKEIQDTFGSSELEPLSKETVNKKGSNEPLVDRGKLAASINYEVRNRE